MRSDKRSKEALNSSAHLSYIDVFVPSEVSLESEGSKQVGHFSPFRYHDLSIQLSPIEDGVVRKFPIILRGDREPWDLGNLYLIRKFTEMAKVEPPSVSTIQSIAKHLTMYLRWIEHQQSEGRAMHELFLPKEAEQRCTWSYYRYLRKLLRMGQDSPISVGVAKARMQAVVGFYRGLSLYELVAETALENPPYEGKLVGIPVVNSSGVQFMKAVETTNFAFRVSRRDQIGTLKDGGNLRPLSEEDQTLILEYLAKSDNRVFQLMCLVALYTGARIQTVCTLRMRDIDSLMEQRSRNGEVLLNIGEGTGVDTKNQKKYRLHVPIQLRDMLRDYMESEEHQERRSLSFYGDSRDNYLFLARNGSPFYTSLKEQSDRQDSKYSQRITAKDRVTFTVQEGNAVRNYLGRLIRDIRRDHPDFNAFRFHDFRATYGMNFVRDADTADVKDVRHELKARMGHSNFETTQAYLKFDEENESVKEAIAYHHDRINSRLKDFN